jgi:hypothetical protein
MTVAELIAELSKLDQNAVVVVNDNNHGEVYGIEQVDYCGDYEDGPCVMLHVNCYSRNKK